MCITHYSRPNSFILIFVKTIGIYDSNTAVRNFESKHIIGKLSFRVNFFFIENLPRLDNKNLN